MTAYVRSTEQLVTEIFVRDIRRSTKFYRRLGFELLRDGGDFVELTWEDHRLFLAELSAVHDVSATALGRLPSFPSPTSGSWCRTWTRAGRAPTRSAPGS
jgi:catechol 2,3-dioxygenase-like lactoylglutathione lyase family enzyme